MLQSSSYQPVTTHADHDDDELHQNEFETAAPIKKTLPFKILFFLFVWYLGSVLYPYQVMALKEIISEGETVKTAFLNSCCISTSILSMPAMYALISSPESRRALMPHYNLIVVALTNYGNIFTVILATLMVGGLKVYLLKTMEPLVICLVHFFVDRTFSIYKLFTTSMAVFGLFLIFPENKTALDNWAYILCAFSICCVSLRAVQIKGNTTFLAISFWSFAASLLPLLASLVYNGVFTAPQFSNPSYYYHLGGAILFQNLYNCCSIRTRVILDDSVQYGLLKSGKRAFVILMLFIFSHRAFELKEAIGFGYIVGSVLIQFGVAYERCTLDTGNMLVIVLFAVNACVLFFMPPKII